MIHLINETTHLLLPRSVNLKHLQKWQHQINIFFKKGCFHNFVMIDHFRPLLLTTHHCLYLLALTYIFNMIFPHDWDLSILFPEKLHIYVLFIERLHQVDPKEATCCTSNKSLCLMCSALWMVHILISSKSQATCSANNSEKGCCCRLWNI